MLFDAWLAEEAEVAAFRRTDSARQLEYGGVVVALRAWVEDRRLSRRRDAAPVSSIAALHESSGSAD